MVTIGISHWPTESVKEIGKRSLEMKAPPAFVKMIGPYMFPDSNAGITAIAIFKYEKSNAGEAAEAIANLYMPYFGVPGFRYSLKLASGTNTTMKMMGFE